MGYKHPFAYGKPSIQACPFAGKCMEYCYADALEKFRENSYKMHLHNYSQVWNQSVEDIMVKIEKGITAAKNVDIIRLNDSGDFVSYNEFLAWALVAQSHPEIIFYGYTKATPYYWKVIKYFAGQLPTNFRISISETDNADSVKGLAKIEADYPQYAHIVYILDTVDSDRPELPFNNEEEQAIKGQSSFKIAVHGTFKKGTPEFEADKYFKRMGKRLDVKVC